MPNTEDYPVRWSTVHFGLNSDSINTDPFESVRATLLARGWLIFIDGDGWQEWGVRPGSGDNDAGVMHIQVAVPTKADVAAVIQMLRSSSVPFSVYLAAPDRVRPEATVIVTPSSNFEERTYVELFD